MRLRVAADHASRQRDLLVGLLVGLLLGGCAWGLGIHHILNWHPAALLAFCGASGAALWVVGVRRALASVAAAAALVVIVVTFTPVMRRPVHALIRSDALPPHLDAVIVLHSGSTRDGLLEPTTTDRLLSGIDLLRRGLATTLIVTEPAEGVSSRRDQFHVIAYGPPNVNVLVAEDVRDTHDEAIKAAALARPRGIGDVAVVTSPIHTARACATFAKAGFRVTCVPALDRKVAVHTLIRPEDRLLAFQEWLYEQLGLIKYRSRRWI